MWTFCTEVRGRDTTCSMALLVLRIEGFMTTTVSSLQGTDSGAARRHRGHFHLLSIIAQMVKSSVDASDRVHGYLEQLPAGQDLCEGLKKAGGFARRFHQRPNARRTCSAC